MKRFLIAFAAVIFVLGFVVWQAGAWERDPAPLRSPASLDALAAELAQTKSGRVVVSTEALRKVINEARQREGRCAGLSQKLEALKRIDAEGAERK